MLITTQYAKSITPTIRANTDFCFVMRTIQESQLESLYFDFANFLTKDAWHQLVKDNTQDNEVLVIDTCSNHPEPLQTLFWWKAIDPGPFLMGTKEYWESAMQNRETVPPAPGQEAASSLLTVADVAPCRRAPVAVPMDKSKWLSRPFWGREGPESGALHRGPPWVCSVHFLLLRLINTTREKGGFFGGGAVLAV